MPYLIASFFDYFEIYEHINQYKIIFNTKKEKIKLLSFTA